MDRQNVTLSLSMELLQEVKMVAVKRHTSLSGLMTEALEQIVDRDDEYERAMEIELAAMANLPNLGTRGGRTWTRDELHERN